MKRFSGITVTANPVKQILMHVKFRDGVLNPPVTWTSIGTDGEIYTYTYPMTGYSEIHAVSFLCGSGYLLNQNPGIPGHVEALQSSKIEFVYTTDPWWHAAAKYSDIVLPARYLGERDDLVIWDNIAIFMHNVAEPVPEARNDFDILQALATKQGFGDQFAQSQTADQWLRTMYSASNVPMTFDDFKTAGFYEFPPAADAATVSFTGFRSDPANNKLPTPSGLVEIYSKRIEAKFGTTTPWAPPLAQYVPPTEGFDNPRAQTYPLLMISPHPKVGRHSQWQNLPWVHAYDQQYMNGFRTMYINPVDAASRGLKQGDVVRVYNDRGAIICSTYVTEKMRPKVIRVWEGGWYQPQKPGDRQSVDLGGNVNVVIAPRIGELTHGQIANSLVQVEKWGVS
jgi:anaerobic selenocysteine-containing dehydrogenase